MKPIQYPHPRDMNELNFIIASTIRQTNRLTRKGISQFATDFQFILRQYNSAVDEKLHQQKCRIKLRSQKLREIAHRERVITAINDTLVNAHIRRNARD